jgi:glutamate---methylamine ligase
MRRELGNSSVKAANAPVVLKLKKQEWNSFKAHLTEWERANTLDI